MATKTKTYDIILFGVTGFTGKLAAEYLLRKQYSIKWAACARTKAKATAILETIADSLSQTSPPLVICDLVCNSAEDEAKLREVVQSTRVVLTAAGPFEKYAITLHKICAQEGVHYADITGETSYVRHVIDKHDDMARQNKATLVSHCGNDCIPHDLTVFEMNEYAKSKGCTLTEVTTLDEFPSSATFSGGTLTTAMYQLSKPKNSATDGFDPLVKSLDGNKSNFKTTITHKGKQYHADFDRKAGPWIMAPVMANCVRRSNAILGYHSNFKFGDACLEDPSWINYAKQTLYAGVIGAALYVPAIRSFLPQPGDGPEKEAMESGWLKLWGLGFMVKKEDTEETRIPIYSLMHFKKDTGYLMTSELLVESGMLLVEKDRAGTLTTGGVLTPAVAFGGDLTKRITTEMEVEFSISDTPMYQT